MVLDVRRRVRVGLVIFVPIAFIGSCIAMIPPALHLTDSMTHLALDDAVHTSFPVVVVNGDQARIVMTDTPHVPPPPTGASFLIPLDQVERIERQVSESTDTVHRDSAWVLRVKQRCPIARILNYSYRATAFRAVSTKRRRIPPLRSIAR